jgi:hypothetical protein
MSDALSAEAKESVPIILLLMMEPPAEAFLLRGLAAVPDC